MAKPRTLYDKIWDDHMVDEQPDGTCLLYIDRHLVHEVTSPQAFEGLRLTGRKVRAPEKTLAVVDHNIPTTDRSLPNPDRQKVLAGLLKACEKRPVSMGRLSELVDRVEGRVNDSPEREISTTEIGEVLMDALKSLDKIAYVRFASVYRDFQDEQAFFNELKNLMRQKNS